MTLLFNARWYHMCMNDQDNIPASFTDQIRPRRIALVVVLVLGIGTVFYHYVEALKWLDSIYFCVVTLATVGYGDITPKTDAGKVFTIFYILFGVAIIAASLSYLLRNAVIKHKSKK